MGLWDKHEYAKCFGNWLVTDKECMKCAVSSNCEKNTKSKEEGRVENPIIKETEDILTPIEYVLQSIRGKYDEEKEERENAVIHRFYDEGKANIAVVVGAFGKVKIISFPKNINKMFGRIGSVEEAEQVLKEIL